MISTSVIPEPDPLGGRTADLQTGEASALSPVSVTPLPPPSAHRSPIVRLVQDMKIGTRPSGKTEVPRTPDTLAAIGELQEIARSADEWLRGRSAVVSFARERFGTREEIERNRQENLERFSILADTVYRELGVADHHSKALIADHLRVMNVVLDTLNPLHADFSLRFSSTGPRSTDVIWHCDDRDKREVTSGGRIGRIIAQYVGPGPWHADIPHSLLQRENTLLPPLQIAARRFEKLEVLLRQILGAADTHSNLMGMRADLDETYRYRGRFPIIKVHEGEISYHLSKQPGFPGGIHTVAPSTEEKNRLQLFGNVRFAA